MGAPLVSAVGVLKSRSFRLSSLVTGSLDSLVKGQDTALLCPSRAGSTSSEPDDKISVYSCLMMISTWPLLSRALALNSAICLTTSRETLVIHAILQGAHFAVLVCWTLFSPTRETRSWHAAYLPTF